MNAQSVIGEASESSSLFLCDIVEKVRSCVGFVVLVVPIGRGTSSLSMLSSAGLSLNVGDYPLRTQIGRASCATGR